MALKLLKSPMAGLHELFFLFPIFTFSFYFLDNLLTRVLLKINVSIKLFELSFTFNINDITKIKTIPFFSACILRVL